MKKVLLLGDSIRMGYQKLVKEELEGICEVYYDEFDNGRFASYTFYQMNQLLKKYKDIDIIHFNNGYWDMNIESPMTESLSTIEEYLHYLEKIVDFGKKLNIKMIFATSLPINDEKKDQAPIEIGYNNTIINKYNKEAVALMKKKDVVINDLYQLILASKNYYKCSDEVHLTLEGYQVCAKQVCEVIKKNL